jgi:acyl-CoA thioesterase I
MKQLSVLFAIIIIFFTVSCDSKKDIKISTTNTESAENIVKTVTKNKTIIFFGNSLTAAFGLNPAEGFALRIQKRLDSLGTDYRVINAGLSGETTAGGKERVDWVISRQKVDIFVLELGGNDALRGLKTEASEKNLQDIIDKVKAKYPDCKILLAGMMAPPNMGKKYADNFQGNYKRLAKQNNIALIPFLLDGVGGITRLNQTDGIHPTAEGNLIITETVWKYLKPLL